MTEQTASNRFVITTPSDREIRMVRSFNAPRALVYEAHTKAEHLRHWWGPKNHTLPVCDIDFREGGRYRFVSRGPDGSEDAFRGEFLKIVAPEMIVWTFEWEGLPGHISTETVVFEEHDGITTITSTSVYASQEDRDGMLQSGMEIGANEMYDRLEELLAR